MQNNLTHNFKNFYLLIIFCVIISVSIICIYFLLPKIGRKLQKTKFQSIKNIAIALENFNFCQSLKILTISALKYFIFSFQFFCVLRFCGVDFSLYNAIFAMPTFYLLITYTPLINATEFAVRSSIGVLIFGVFSQNIAGIIVASTFFWLLNFCIPTLCGIITGINYKKLKKN
jgi:hypothetical protein